MKPKSINATKMGSSNKKILLNMIRYSSGITRREIAAHTGLNPSTVTNIINSLKDLGLVYEKGKKKSEQPGRNSIMLEPRKESAASFIVHVGVEKTKAGIGYLNNSFEILEEINTPENADLFFDGIVHIIQSYEGQADPFGISFSVPGTVDTDSNYIYSLPHVGWKNIDINDEINKRIPDNPFSLLTANEAKLSLKSEKALNEQLKDLKNGIYIYLSQGVGGAVLIRDIIYSGKDFIAGEIGHMSINKNGPICRCGNRGCLETYIGIDMIIDQYEENETLKGQDTRAKFREFLKKYKASEPLAVDICNEMKTYLLQGIKNLINILNPDFIIIGGMGNEFPQTLFDEINSKIKKNTLNPAGVGVRVLPSYVDIDHSTLHGCTLTAMDEFVNKIIK